ncbi:MAG: cation:proton antiporter [Candidatus Pacearchaeota archaeon]
MEEIIKLSLVFLIVLIVSVIFKALKQPLIISYIFSGVLIGPIFFNLVSSESTLRVFSEFGIAFLLFMVGLNLNPTIVREVGKVSLVTGIGQIVFTSVIGFFICKALGFSVIASLYISIALTFSSTIIIMKLLSDKDALEKLYGRISIGFLIVQDLVAVIILIFVSSFSKNVGTLSSFAFIFLKGMLVFFLLTIFGKIVLKRIENFLASSQEFLFLFSIVFGLSIAGLFNYIGVGLEVGALIGGIILSRYSFAFDVSSKMKPLRDFFLISFFVLLGSEMVLSNMSGLLWPSIIFSLFILIGNPLIVIALMGYLGYSKKTGFMAGLTVAQISEFSLILIAMGVRAGHIVIEKVGGSFIHIPSLVSIVGMVTIAGSSYMILYSEKIYKILERPLSIFERKNIKEKEILGRTFYDYVLIGENRVGFSIMEYFLEKKKNYLIIDFNPVRVKKLKEKGINCVYGDVSNAALIEDLYLDKAKMVVSTVPDVDTNLTLVSKIREKNKDIIIIATCSRVSEVNSLYKVGADFVIVPNVVAGERLAELIRSFDLNKKDYEKLMKKQLKNLEKRLKY